MPELLFVYGTLRRTCRSDAHNRYLAGAIFIADAKLQAKLYRVSYYPAVVLTNEDCWVQGEIYQLRDTAQLAALDEYEECKTPADANQEYIRASVNVVMASGEQQQAWVYLYNRPTDSLALIGSGDFLNP